MASATEGHLGMKRSEETKKRIAEAGKGRILSDSHKMALLSALKGHAPWYAKTPEALANQRNRRRGVKNTSEHNAKISASKMGHVVSQEQREKQREKMLGRKHSAEAKAKQSAAQKMWPPFSKEWRDNMSKAQIAYFEKKRQAGESLKQSPETIAKKAEALKAYHAKLKAEGKKRTFSDESKAKMRASRLAFIEKQKLQNQDN
jgi:hypothetical protein